MGNERGELIAYLARQGMNVARANQLIRQGMTRGEVLAALTAELAAQ